MDHVLARPGVAQALAGQPFNNGFFQDRILKGMQLRFQFFGESGFLVDFAIQLKFLLAHSLVFLHDRRVPNGNSQNGGHDQKNSQHPRQSVPYVVRSTQPDPVKHKNKNIGNQFIAPSSFFGQGRGPAAKPMELLA